MGTIQTPDLDWHTSSYVYVRRIYITPPRRERRRRMEEGRGREDGGESEGGRKTGIILLWYYTYTGRFNKTLHIVPTGKSIIHI